MQAIPDGRTLLLGPPTAMSLIDPDGVGALTAAGSRDSIARGYGSYANFDVGRFLVAGGGNVNEDGLTGVPTRTARVVDTRSGAPVATATGSLITRRRQHQLTVLADGSVARHRRPEDQRRRRARRSRQRVLHRRALGPGDRRMDRARARRGRAPVPLDGDALPDGRVLTGGGGICGACQTVGYLRRDFEIFTPPYLYRHDGSGGSRRGRADKAACPTPRLEPARSRSPRRRPRASQARARAARRADPQSGPEPALRAAGLHAPGTTIAAAAPQQPQRGARGPLHAVRRRRRRRPDRRARSCSVQRPVVTAPAPVNLALGRPATGSAACASGGRRPRPSTAR